MYTLVMLWLMAGMGSPDWQVRSKAIARADNLVFAYLAPTSNNPEVRCQIYRIQSKHLYRLEQATFHYDLIMWTRKFAMRGRNIWMPDYRFVEWMKKETWEFKVSYAMNFPPMWPSTFVGPPCRADIYQFRKALTTQVILDAYFPGYRNDRDKSPSPSDT